ncbi:hypothetical protein V6Z11_A06G044100 [Gossypium hirsutum]
MDLDLGGSVRQRLSGVHSIEICFYLVIMIKFKNQVFLESL